MENLIKTSNNREKPGTSRLIVTGHDGTTTGQSTGQFPRDFRRKVVTLRHPSKGGPVGTSSDDGIRRDPSRLRVVGLKLALCELVG